MAPPVEISIPTTSLSTPSSDSKPYTLYNITLRLPLRSFVVQKRYSDFDVLNRTLTSLVGSPPPQPLPKKSWFKSTLSSPELTEQRRRDLERYLRAVAETPDRRWRDTSAWRAFLNLPSSGGGGGSAGNSAASASGRIEARVPQIGLAGANAAAAADPGTWIDLHKEAKRALHEARLQVARRDSAGADAAAAEAGAAAKRELVKAGSLLGALAEGLRSMQEGKRLGEGEVRRRRDLLAAAGVEREGLEKLSASLASGGGGGGHRSGGSGVAGSSREGTPGVAGERSALLLTGGGGSGPRAGGRVLGAPLPETERTRELDNTGVLQLQREMLAEQDDGVEALAKIVRRQKEMGLAIKEEVDAQTEMLDRMNEDVERVGRKVKVGKDRTRKLG